MAQSWLYLGGKAHTLRHLGCDAGMDQIHQRKVEWQQLAGRIDDQSQDGVRQILQWEGGRHQSPDEDFPNVLRFPRFPSSCGYLGTDEKYNTDSDSDSDQT